MHNTLTVDTSMAAIMWGDHFSVYRDVLLHHQPLVAVGWDSRAWQILGDVGNAILSLVIAGLIGLAGSLSQSYLMRAVFGPSTGARAAARRSRNLGAGMMVKFPARMVWVNRFGRPRSMKVTVRVDPGLCKMYHRGLRTAATGGSALVFGKWADEWGDPWDWMLNAMVLDEDERWVALRLPVPGMSFRFLRTDYQVIMGVLSQRE